MDNGLFDLIKSSKVQKPLDERLNSQNGLKFDAVSSHGITFMNNPAGDSFPPSGCGADGSDGNDSTDPVLKYISQMLMEENMEDQPYMLADLFALNATEKSLKDAIGGNFPPSDDYSTLCADHPRSNGGLSRSGNEHNDYVLQFQKGLEEASRFLPNVSNLVIDLEGSKEDSPAAAMMPEKMERRKPADGSKGRKTHQRENSDVEEGRTNKVSAQSSLIEEESELNEYFDEVLWPEIPENDDHINGERRQMKEEENIDLRTLLIICAQSISSNDFRTTQELLNQIRRHSDRRGDGSLRLASYFADGLEARLAGSGYTSRSFHEIMFSKEMKASDVLKAYKTHFSYCPFKKLSIYFSNKMIYSVAENAKTLHIIDFGVTYGFQWPILIQFLSQRPQGPPKLRITGIELPQPGFRPTERIKETGRRLEKYCQSFGVPFEYNPIAAKNWETIPISDLKIRPGEVVAVYCLYRFKHISDESAEGNSPRDAILELIRKLNPNIFVHSVVNGSYNAPFFITRFREALFHYSAVFDMLDSTLPRENEERAFLEREFYGREAINAVACEGPERVVRPETYKQWHSRSRRAGLKAAPLKREIYEECKEKMKELYHKDFVIDEDNEWMLIGWKGRIIYASSCWVPV